MSGSNYFKFMEIAGGVIRITLIRIHIDSRQITFQSTLMKGLCEDEFVS